MKYLKSYENRFTNIFKSTDSSNQETQDFMNAMYDKDYNPLMGAAAEGNWKRFKFLLPDYKDKINDVLTIHLDNGSDATENILSFVVTGKGDLWEKKKMIASLIENGVDVSFENENGKNFYERITSPKLKEWIGSSGSSDETYPNIPILKDVNKYNL